MSLTLTPDDRIVTNSEIETFKECRRKWWLGYLRKLTPIKWDDSGDAARLGNLVHDGLEMYYADPTDPKAEAKALAQIPGPDGLDKKVDKQRKLARAILIGYFEWLEDTGADQGLEFTNPEMMIEAPAPIPGWRLRGKIDVLVTDEKTGEVMIGDHKTTSSFSRSYSDLHILRQPRMYSLIMRLIAASEGEESELTGVLWNLLRTVDPNGTGKPPFFARKRFHYTDDDLRRYYNELRYTLRDMQWAEEEIAASSEPERVAYPTPSKDCSWKCQFYPVCGFVDGRPGDAEAVLESEFDIYDPLERYTVEESAEVT